MPREIAIPDEGIHELRIGVSHLRSSIPKGDSPRGDIDQHALCNAVVLSASYLSVRLPGGGRTESVNRPSFGNRDCRVLPRQPVLQVGDAFVWDCALAMYNENRRDSLRQ